MLATAWIGPGQIPEPRTQARSPTGMTKTQLLKPSPLLLGVHIIRKLELEAQPGLKPTHSGIGYGISIGILSTVLNVYPGRILLTTTSQSV